MKILHDGTKEGGDGSLLVQVQDFVLNIGQLDDVFWISKQSVEDHKQKLDTWEAPVWFKEDRIPDRYRDQMD